MINRKTLLNELPSYGVAGNASYAWDVAKSYVGAVDTNTVQLRAMVSDLAHGVSGAPERFFTWFSKNIGMSVGGIKKYFGSLWSSVGSSNNIFMKVIHQIGSAIGAAINYAVKLLAPLISQAKKFMGTSVSGLYGVTNGQLVVCVVIFACIIFIVYKIYKRIKNRRAKKQSQSQTPQKVVKEAKEMLYDTMDAVTEGINTFKCCDYLTEGLGITQGVTMVAKIIQKGSNLCGFLYNALFGKKQADQNIDNTTGAADQTQDQQINPTEGFNIFEGDYYDRGSSNPTILQNKVFISTALLCIAVVLGFFAFTNLATGISTLLNPPFGWTSWIGNICGAIFGSSGSVGIFDIQKIALSPKVIGAAAGAGIAYRASKQVGPVREYR